MTLAEGLEEKPNEVVVSAGTGILPPDSTIQELAQKDFIGDANSDTNETKDSLTKTQTEVTLPAGDPNSSKKKKKIIFIAIVLGFLIVGFIFLFLILPALTIMKLDPVKQVKTLNENSLINLIFNLKSSVDITKIDFGVYPWEKVPDPKVKELVILPLNTQNQYTYKWFSPGANSGLEDYLPIPADSALTYDGVYFVTTKESYGFCFIPTDLTATLAKNTNLSKFQDKYACAMGVLVSSPPAPPTSVFEKYNKLSD